MIVQCRFIIETYDDPELFNHPLFRTGLNILSEEEYNKLLLRMDKVNLYIHTARFIRLAIISSESTLKKMIILSEKYYLYDIKTIKKFNLEITANYVAGVCRWGSPNILDYINNKHGGLMRFTSYNHLKYEYYHASEYGNVNVLEWLKNSGLPFVYFDGLLLNKFRCINVLEWWKNSGLPLKYDEKVLHKNLKNFDPETLKWWFNSGLISKSAFQNINIEGIQLE
jgi:hypothetical protein